MIYSLNACFYRWQNINDTEQSKNLSVRNTTAMNPIKRSSHKTETSDQCIKQAQKTQPRTQTSLFFWVWKQQKSEIQSKWQREYLQYFCCWFHRWTVAKAQAECTQHRCISELMQELPFEHPISSCFNLKYFYEAVSSSVILLLDFILFILLQFVSIFIKALFTDNSFS